MTIEIFKSFRFEASHMLPKHKGKCARLHGHSWELTIGVSGQVDPETGFVLDYAVLKRVVDQHIIDKLDHAHLGYGIAYAMQNGKYNADYAQCPFGFEFYPSSENLVVAIGKILQPLIKEIRNGIRLSETSLNETCTSRATWRPEIEPGA